MIFWAPYRLEPNAPAEGIKTIYDRSANGPTHVVSLLPGNIPPATNSSFEGVSPDGRDVVFTVSASTPGDSPWYVRDDNTTTHEVVRPDGVVVGKKLTCTGAPASAALTYQWLSDGTPIGGATSATYTTTVADEGKVIQCQVTATVGGGGASVNASTARLVEPYQGRESRGAIGIQWRQPERNAGSRPRYLLAAQAPGQVVRPLPTAGLATASKSPGPPPVPTLPSPPTRVRRCSAESRARTRRAPRFPLACRGRSEGNSRSPARTR